MKNENCVCGGSGRVQLLGSRVGVFAEVKCPKCFDDPKDPARPMSIDSHSKRFVIDAGVQDVAELLMAIGAGIKGMEHLPTTVKRFDALGRAFSRAIEKSDAKAEMEKVMIEMTESMVTETLKVQRQSLQAALGTFRR